MRRQGEFTASETGEQVRVYDGVIDLGNGDYVGIEVKSAKGTGQAQGFRIVGVRLVNV